MCLGLNHTLRDISCVRKSLPTWCSSVNEITGLCSYLQLPLIENRYAHGNVKYSDENLLLVVPVPLVE